MSKKTAAVAFWTRHTRTTPVSIIKSEIMDAPVREIDRSFLNDVCIKKLSYKELAAKYYRSEKTIYAWKRRLYEKMHSLYGG
jgi:hypothetical protein